MEIVCVQVTNSKSTRGAATIETLRVSQGNKVRHLAAFSGSTYIVFNSIRDLGRYLNSTDNKRSGVVLETEAPKTDVEWGRVQQKIGDLVAA